MKKKLLNLILKCTSVLFGFIKVTVRFMPDRVKAQFAEKMIFLGRLDFPIAEIKLLISTSYSLVRLRSCSKEKHTVNWINTFSIGDVFYDIGANVGTYSLIASKLGKCDMIFAFEPVPGTFYELLSNLKLNQASNITACNICLSDTNSTSIFQLSSDLPGGALHDGINSNQAGNTTNFICPTLTIDNFIEINNYRKPNHLKIDVDGAELNILKGAVKTLAYEELKSIQIEIDELSDSNIEINSILNSNGFIIDTKNFKSPNCMSTYDALFKKRIL